MTDTQICGLAVVCLATVVSAYGLLRKYEIDKRFKFTSRATEEYLKVRNEADSWRKAYEEQTARVKELEALLRVQNLVYGKRKVADYGKDLHAGKRTETTLETKKHE